MLRHLPSCFALSGEYDSTYWLASSDTMSSKIASSSAVCFGEEGWPPVERGERSVWVGESRADVGEVRVERGVVFREEWLAAGRAGIALEAGAKLGNGR